MLVRSLEPLFLLMFPFCLGKNISEPIYSGYNNNMKYVINSLILISLLSSPLSFVYGQTVTDPTSVTDPTTSNSPTVVTPEAETVADPTPAEDLTTSTASSVAPITPDSQSDSSDPAIDPTQVPASPQNTVTDQQTTDSSILESTVDPSTTAPGTDTTTLPDPTASTSIPVDPSVTDPSISVPVTPIQSTQPDTAVTVFTAPSTPIAQVQEEELEPKEKYTFALTGATIPTKAHPDWKKAQGSPQTGSSQVTATPTLSADDTNGALDISGSCNDPYFVVLLYKNQEDYDAHPTSYIFNKAFDCQNGTYQYSLKDLPKTLADGTYYLLIGGQGDKGSWAPISALMPVTIQKENE
jgi:hypothetical protein